MTAAEDIEPLDDDECLLLEYQREWVYDETPVKVAAKSRQIGFTWGTAYEAVEVAARQKSSGGMDVYFMTLSREDARKFITLCTQWIKWLTPVIEGLIDELEVQESDDWFEDTEGERLLAFRIDFPSGNTIYALPSRPARFRGNQGYAIIDEAAQQDIEAIQEAAGGFLIWGGRIAYISTYLGADNQFYKLVQDIRTGEQQGRLHEVNIYDALEQGLYRRMCRLKRREWSAEAEAEWLAWLRGYYGEQRFRQECECIVSHAGSSVYSREAINRCCVLGPAECTIIELRGGETPQLWINSESIDVAPSSWDEKDPKSEPVERQIEAIKRWLDLHVAPVLERLNAAGLPVHAGLDYGRTRNLSTWTYGFKRRDATRRVAMIFEIEKLAWPVQDYISDYIIDRLRNIAAGCADAQGGGQNSAERASSRTRGKIRPVQIVGGWHEPQFTNLGKRISEQSMQLPRHFEPLVDDLSSLRREKGKIVAPERRSEDGRKQIRHADAAFSLALFEQSIGTDGPTPNDNVISLRRARRRKRRR